MNLIGISGYIKWKNYKKDAKAPNKTCTVIHASVFRHKDKKTGENVWDSIKMVAFGQTADYANDVFKVGDAFEASGSLYNDEFIDKDGKRRDSYFVRLDHIAYAPRVKNIKDQNNIIEDSESNTEDGEEK